MDDLVTATTIYESPPDPVDLERVHRLGPYRARRQRRDRGVGRRTRRGSQGAIQLLTKSALGAPG